MSTVDSAPETASVGMPRVIRRKAPAAPAEELRARRPINAEDQLIYSFMLLIVVLLSAYFLWATNTLNHRMEAAANGAAAQLAFITDDPDRSFLAAQSYLAIRRYDHAALAVYSNSVRNNTGFMVGTVMVLMGSLVIVRRIREHPVEADLGIGEARRFHMTTGSPGIVMVVAGAGIIITTVLNTVQVNVADDGVWHPIQAKAGIPVRASGKVGTQDLEAQIDSMRTDSIPRRQS